MLVLRVILAWCAGMTALVVLDLVWIGVIASNFYKSQTGHLLNMVDGNMQVNIPAALATWAVIVTGVQVFVFPRAGASASLLQVLLWGAVFGAVVYAVYDLTNYALLKDWPLVVTVVDIFWGAVVCASTALAIALANRVLERFL
jgi:uncharacterized membrane protein